MKFRWLKINFDAHFDSINIKDLLELMRDSMAKAFQIPKAILFAQKSEQEKTYIDLSEQGNKILAQGGEITGFALTPNGIEVEGVIPNEKRSKE